MNRRSFVVDYRDPSVPMPPLPPARAALVWDRVRRMRADFLAGRPVEAGVALGVAGDADGRDWLRSMSVARRIGQTDRPALARWKAVATSVRKAPTASRLPVASRSTFVRVPQPGERGYIPASWTARR